VAILMDVAKLGAVLDDAYVDLFGIAPHIKNQSSTRNLLAKRIVVPSKNFVRPDSREEENRRIMGQCWRFSI
jgi:hypothetical protein